MTGFGQEYVTICVPGKATFLKAIREMVEQSARDFGFENDSCEQIVMAVDEACTNIVKHGYQNQQKEGKIYLKVSVCPKNLVVEVMDEACRFSSADEKGMNLLENAIKFRREESPVIHVGYKQTETEHTFSIKDNGIGIKSDFFERIFGPFQQLHPKNHLPGTGMGLPICKRIIERHGGRIWLESAPDAGSTFFFSILRTTD